MYIICFLANTKHMNQILITNVSNSIKKINIKGYQKTNNEAKKIPSKSFFKNLLAFSLGALVVFSIYAIYGFQTRNQKEKLSEGLLDSFSLSTLYAQENNYTATPVQQELTGATDFSVIGIIKIDSIKISYPILSKINDDLLKISPCRFYGPMPNQIGNLCIAAHNYNDNRFFSKLDKLQNNDIIYIYDALRKFLCLLNL